MSDIGSWRHGAIHVLDTFIWYAYLFLLLAVSFINDYYSSAAWLMLSGCVYLLSGLCAYSAINGGRCNWYGLKCARYAILILAGMLLLLGLQTVVPISQHTDILLLDNSLFDAEAPAWFEPSKRWSIVPDKTRWLFNSEILFSAIFVLSIALLCSRRRLKQLLYAMLIIGLIHSLVGIVAKYGSIILVDVNQLDGHYTAARAWFINRNHYAAFISLCLIGGLVFQLKLLMSKKRMLALAMIVDQLSSYKILYFVSLILGVIALVLSQSRAGFLAFLLSLLLVLVSVGRDRLAIGLGFSRRKLVLSGVIMLFFIIAYFGSELLYRFSSDSFLGERIEQWKLTWQAIEQVWVLGYGGNSYADVFQISRGYQDFRQVLYNQSHNDYLHIWLEQGLLGLMLWLGLLAAVIRSAYTGLRNTTSTLVASALISVLVVLFAALAQSSVDFNLQILNIRYYFFVIMSLAFSVPSIRQRKGTPENSVLV